MSYKDYIPVPVWNGSEWEPRDMRRVNTLMEWPIGFDPSTLAPPPVHLGQRISFEWNPGEVWSGEVRSIELSGGAISDHEDVAREIARRYAPDAIRLSVNARGHLRSVRISRLVQ